MTTSAIPSAISRIGIVAAMARELAPLVERLPVKHPMPGVSIYEGEFAVYAIAGMGRPRAELAARALLDGWTVHRVVSAGWAGALHSGLRVGETHRPRTIVDAATGERFETGEAGGMLVTAPAVADTAEKRRLHERYGADLVDMEAAAVARVAGERGLPFLALKAVSDGHDFHLPSMERFVTATGQFREKAFVGHLAVRPWLWRTVGIMAQNSANAAAALCRDLEELVAWDAEAFRAYRRH